MMILGMGGEIMEANMKKTAFFNEFRIFSKKSLNYFVIEKMILSL